MSSNGPPNRPPKLDVSSPPPPKKKTVTKSSKQESADNTSEFITGIVIGDLIDETS
jgi:hypothetical protein